MIKIGEELVEKELRKYNLSLGKLRKAGKLLEAAQKHRFRTETECLIAIGYEKIRVDTLLPDLVPPERLSSPPPPTQETAFTKVFKKIMPRREGGIVVDGMDDIATVFPKCCAPVHGDPVVGFVTRGRGVTVHRKDCVQVINYDPARRLDVHWDTQSRQLRPVEIRIYSVDTPGLLASISQSFHSAGVNISAVNCRTTPEKRAVNNFTVLVHDLDQLKKVMAMIEKIEGVSSVEPGDAGPAGKHQSELPQRRREHLGGELPHHTREARGQQLHRSGQRPRSAQARDGDDREDRGRQLRRAPRDLGSPMALIVHRP
jgi:guanosine-3',5'-bis(diphosphate) 3'-pyrophosphohydrolase